MGSASTIEKAAAGSNNTKIWRSPSENVALNCAVSLRNGKAGKGRGKHSRYLQSSGKQVAFCFRDQPGLLAEVDAGPGNLLKYEWFNLNNPHGENRGRPGLARRGRIVPGEIHQQRRLQRLRYHPGN